MHESAAIRWLLVAGIATCALVVPYPASGLNPSIAPTQYIHRSFQAVDGYAIWDVEALAQTTDGYLWVGTHNGLVRFNGMQFSAWSPPGETHLPSSRVTALDASSDGSLWIATVGGVSHSIVQRTITYTVRDGLPEGTAVALHEDRAGRLWVGTTGAATGGMGLIERGSRTVRRLRDAAQNLGGQSFFEDRRGDLWIGTPRGIWRLQSPGMESCRLLSSSADIVSIAGDSADRLFVIDRASRAILSVGEGKVSERIVPNVGAGSMPLKVALIDHDDNLWVGTLGQGLLRIRNGKVSQYTKRNGLSSDVVLSLFEDHSGSLWVGTAAGLDRFRDPNVVRYTTLEGLSGDLCTAVCPSRDGSIWIGTSGGGLNRLRNGVVATYAVSSGLPSNTIISLDEDADGTLWVGTDRGIARSKGAGFQRVPIMQPGRASRIFAIAGGGVGDSWAVDSEQSLLQIRDRRGRRAGVAGLLSGRNIYTLKLDRKRRLWVGYYQGGVTVLDNGAAHSFLPPDGPVGGPVSAIFEDHEGALWVGTGEGLSRFKDGRWSNWISAQGLPPGEIQGIVEGVPGDLWIATAGGIVRLRTRELARVARGEQQRLAVTMYGPLDAVRLPEARKMASPRLAKSSDGRIWAATEDGLAMLDPVRIHLDSLPPSVTIERVAVDGETVDTAQEEVAFRGSRLEIEYTAVNLAEPEAVRFRYRLEGLDTNWIDAGAARRIVYANLAPGRYRLRVIACNSDAVWNLQGASIGLWKRPLFYQTPLFQAGCLAAASLLAFTAYWLRLRNVRHHYALVMHERSRMTRELHDTLLQGFVGVVYQLEAASRKLDVSVEQCKECMERALEQADRSLREARQVLTCLHISIEEKTLPEALNAVGEQLVNSGEVRFSMHVTGSVREFPYEVQGALYLIAREALVNALNHAEADQLTLSMTYRDDNVQIVVSDDGIGFDTRADRNRNQWGLDGMQERAKQIGATLEITSAPGAGTRVGILFANRKRNFKRTGASKETLPG